MDWFPLPLPLLSTDSAKKAQITEVRGHFTHLPFIYSWTVSISIDGTHNVQFLLYVYIWNSPEQMPSPFGAGPAHEKKIGHRRVDASGETTYKKAGVSSSSVFLFSPATLHPHLTLLFFTLFSASRPPPLHCKGPSSWALATLSAPSAPSLREMCWCRTFTLWRASSSPGAFVWENVRFCACLSQVSNLKPLFFTLPVGLILLHTVKAATLLRPTTTQTLGLKPTPLWRSATSESCLGSVQMTIWWDIWGLRWLIWHYKCQQRSHHSFRGPSTFL